MSKLLGWHAEFLASLPLHHVAGSYNIVYKLSFFDGIQWAIRIPAEGDVRKPSRVRSFYLDIVTQRFISSRTSIPIPRIHYWSLDSSNLLLRPFVIMDFISGTNLSKLWNDRNWITDQKREKIFEQIAGWMTELSALEFDQIGCLDWDEASGTHRIVPFPDSSAFLVRLWQDSEELDSAAVPAGLFNTAHEYLSFLLSLRRRISDSSILAILQLFLSALPDMTLDGPPFMLCPPDFNSQNVLVDDDGTVTGIIDWDGVRTLPRQGGAAAYPAWLTEDWVPLSYRWKKDASPEDNMHYDYPTELGSYRRAYLDAITRASGGKLTHITRNSHIWTTLHDAICSEISGSSITYHLSKFVFGRSIIEVERGIRGGAWFSLKNAPEAIAEFADDANEERDSDGIDDGSAH
ncbi:kinase-like domain-containing protein [Amanita rubescens]|nr:kinase-like domain-containing protein [Amanita rubescens]